MYLISTSMGNDSIALIQWAHEKQLDDCYVVYANTGWCHPDWPARVKRGMALADSYGFTTWSTMGMFSFEEAVRFKGGFPNNKYQWCSGIIKSIPLNDFANFIDPYNTATVVIGKRREESKDRANTPEYIKESEYHEYRKVWHPLYKHTEKQRDELVIRAGFKPLPHRSMECCPCVNANRNDLVNTPESQIEKVRKLESEVGRNMFKPSRSMGAEGIDEVMEWAHSGKGRYSAKQVRMFDNYRCQSGLCD